MTNPNSTAPAIPAITVGVNLVDDEDEDDDVEDMCTWRGLMEQVGRGVGGMWPPRARGIL